MEKSKMRKDVHGVERSKDFFSLALFLETQLVDHGGEVVTAHMNSEDMDIAKDMEKEGLITFKRLPGGYVFGKTGNSRKASYRVEFNEKMWEIAHRERRDRAERLVPKSKLCTGEWKLTLFEKTICGTGSLEKDMIKVAFQIVEIVCYGVILYYFFNL